MSNNHWLPSASMETLRLRAEFLRNIRSFFEQRQVMEVDPPLLYRGVATDPHLAAFKVGDRFLQTSPEFPMKRLIAAGSGAIYSLGKAFRAEEVGIRHNPEFTMLEWYRPFWDHFQLIEEMNSFFQTMLNCPPLETTTYATLFQSYFNIDPHSATQEEIASIAKEKEWSVATTYPLSKDEWLDVVMTHGIEPYLGLEQPLVVLDYPASQASLAKIRWHENKKYEVAERFEVYYKGLELANGYHEINCAKEQRKRFEQDLSFRKRESLPLLPIDEHLISALASGFPNCSGVALGVDRLFMLKLGEKSITKVLPFAWEQA